ncbi:uncharacterized protein PITG_16384 [Phytophthora infestans T30-4]|uniref:Uncharacterized protein n=1 Tax=Phytophthora infestans (strain T30-4) TaxID=403677 RepID=D0NU57_PHYIT|nr:uncharacterized protein PITG_16384 [Phytophthora infestans T30-4]EEY65181.1 conserved hypothetical protein [Phytophthora infestans T30-4]|eukprot:XP_002897438.1 conserved hypothetical protein [Phytophthora infestans T30-4]
MRQLVVQEEMLQTTQKRIETNYRLIRSRIQSKQDQRIKEMQQQTDTQLRDFGNRFKSTQAELPQRVETLVKLSLERRNDSLQDQLQQKLLKAQAQPLRDIESKNQNSFAAISAKLDRAAVETAGLHTKQELFESRIERTMQHTKKEVNEHLTSIILRLDKRHDLWQTTPIIESSQDVSVASETQAPMSLETRQLDIPDAVVNSPKRGARPLPDTQHGTQVLSGGMNQSLDVVWNYEFKQAPMQGAEPIARSLQSLLYASASDDERNIALKKSPLMQRLADLFREHLKNVKTFARRAAVRALEALLRVHAGDTAHASSKKDQFDIHTRSTDSSFVVRAQSIKSLSAILLKFPRDEDSHNL